MRTCGLVIHAAHFHVHVSARLLPVPQRDRISGVRRSSFAADVRPQKGSGKREMECSKVKIVTVVLFIAGLAAAGFWYITENDRADRELAYKRQQEHLAKIEAMEKERAERQREEDERIRKERAAAVAKEDAVRMFLNYIDREEERLKEVVEEAQINLQKIEIDQSSLEEELQAIERANEARVASSEKRGEVQRDIVERVRALLKSVTLNRLAREYCGEDLSKLHSEFEAEMKKTKDVDDRYQKRIRSNLEKYDETVKGVDAEVDKKMKIARAKYESTQKQMDPDRLNKLKKQLADIEQKIEKNLRKKQARTKWDERDLRELEQRQALLQSQVSNYTGISGLAEAGSLHMDATEAETAARRKYDRAGQTLTMDNTAALNERIYEQSVYERVREFRGRSLDRIQAAINSQWNARSETLAKAKKHLSYLKQKAVNLDFLTAEEVEAMRKDIANSISRSIIEVEAGK